MSQAPNWDSSETTNVVTAIPGYNENSEEGGKPRNSAIPGGLDSHFHGDFRLGLPDSLTDALGSKSLEEYDRTFPNYRMNTGVNIAFNSDGQSIPDDEYDVLWESNASPITLEGGPGESTVFREELDALDGDQQHLEADTAGPFTREQLVTVTDENGDNFDGVRGSIIFGGRDPYIVRMQQAGYPLTAIFAFLIPPTVYRYWTRIPYFYSFLDFVFMADGTKLVRVWDASRYPLHALYVGEPKQRETTFREGVEWTVDGPVSEDVAFNQFVEDSRWPDRTPFRELSLLNYVNAFRAGEGDHPVLEYEFQGTSLTTDTVRSQLSSPFVPLLL